MSVRRAVGGWILFEILSCDAQFHVRRPHAKTLSTIESHGVHSLTPRRCTYFLVALSRVLCMIQFQIRSVSQWYTTLRTCTCTCTCTLNGTSQEIFGKDPAFEKRIKNEQKVPNKILMTHTITQWEYNQALSKTSYCTNYRHSVLHDISLIFGLDCRMR